MIVFWSDNYKSSGSKKSCGVIDRGYNLIRTTLMNPYQIEYKEKILEEDTVDKNDINVMIIPVLGDYCDFIYSREIKLVVEIATGEGIKCFIDYSWECVFVNSLFWWERGAGNLLSSIDHMKEYDVKIIANKEDYKSVHKRPDNVIDLLDNRIKKFDLFKYETRISQIEYKKKNKLWRMDTHYTARKNKKYNFTALCGSVSKMNNALLFSALHATGLLNDKNFWTLINTPRDIKLHGSWYTNPDSPHHKEILNLTKEDILNKTVEWKLDNLMTYFFKFKDEILQTRLFDNPDFNEHGRLPIHQERRIPQQYYDSHFSLCIETTRTQAFFTEKVYKPVSIGLPFLIFGSWFQNTIFNETYGYQLFDEIWDYSFEKPLNSEKVNMSNLYKYVNDYVIQISKVLPDAERIFNQPSVIEKTEYNRELFEKTTTRKCLIKDLNRIFGEDN